MKFLKKLIQKYRKPTSFPSRFLIISTTGIGDTLWSTPALRALKKKHPKAHLTLLTSPIGKVLLKNNPYIDKVLTFKPSLIGNLKLLLWIFSFRKKGFEAAFIFHTSTKLILPFLSLSNIPKIIGIEKHAKEWKHLLTHPYVLDYVHPTLQRLTLLQEVQVHSEDYDLELILDAADIKKGEDFLHKEGIQKGEILLGFQTSAFRPFKEWPQEHFIQLAHLILEKYKVKFLLLGGEKDKKGLLKLQKKIPSSYVSAGLPIRVNAALIQRLSGMVTNDTGPMHIGLCFHIPLVAIFSPTGPELTWPYNLHPRTQTIAKPMTCELCVRGKCFKPYCMAQITPHEVFQKVEILLDALMGA